MTYDARLDRTFLDEGDHVDAFGCVLSVDGEGGYRLKELGEACDLRHWDEASETWLECSYAFDLPGSHPYYGQLYHEGRQDADDSKAATETSMYEYEIEVTRVAPQHLTLTVWATSQKEAEEQALIEAPDRDFTAQAKGAGYHIDSVTKLGG